MKKALLFISGFALLGVGLYKYYKKQIDILKKYTWQITGVRILKVSLNELTLDLNILFRSQSALEAKINKIYLEIYLENKIVGYLTELNPFIIPSMGSSNVPLRISINPQSVFTNIVDLVFNVTKQRDVMFKIKGYANLTSASISTTVPIEYENTVKKMMEGDPTPSK